MSELEREAAELTRKQELEGSSPAPLRSITDVRSDPGDGFGTEGESLGDGAFISPEPYKVYKRPDGTVFRTVPISEAEDLEEQFVMDGILPPDSSLLQKPVLNLKPLNRQQRETIVELMAVRLLDDYMKKPRELTIYNPVYDGIPYDVSPGSPQSLQPRNATLTPATTYEILEWFKRIIGVRAEFINVDRFGKGHKADAATTLRIHREPIGSGKQ